MKKCHDYLNLAQPHSILRALAAHGTIYEENPSSHHGGMCKDVQMDGWTRRIPIFPDSAIVEEVIIKHLTKYEPFVSINDIILSFPPHGGLAVCGI